MSKELIERLREAAAQRVASTAMIGADDLIAAAYALEIATAGMNAYCDELGSCRKAAGFGSADDPMAQEGVGAFSDPLCVAAFVESQFKRIVAERDALAAELKALRARLKTGGEARACQSCNGHGQVGGFGGWAAPGYIAEECPACLGSGHDWQPGADDLVGLRGCNSRHGVQRAEEPCIYRMRTTDPGCMGCVERDEYQPAKAGDSILGEQK